MSLWPKKFVRSVTTFLPPPSPNPANTHVNTHERFPNSRTAVHTHSQPSPPAPLHAATSRRPEVEAVPPHQRLVAGEVGSLSSNGTLPVASSSKSWIAPSRAPSKGLVRDSNVRDADKIVTLIWRREDVLLR